MYKLIFILFLMSINDASAQSENIMLKQSAYHTLINSLLSKSVDTISTSATEDQDYLFLDAREKKEFDISRIKNAKYVGYDLFDISCMKNVAKDTKIVVYCSVGYRSEKIGEKLKTAGFSYVQNLYGGIFEWVNEGKSVVDKQGNVTKKVHGYSRTWGIWVDSTTVVYD